LRHYDAIHQMPNPWQRRKEALLVLADRMDAWVAMRGSDMLAYAVGWAMQDVIRFMDCAMHPDEAAAMHSVLDHVRRGAPQATASIINVGEDDPVLAVLREADYQETGMQFEMQVSLV